MTDTITTEAQAPVHPLAELANEVFVALQDDERVLEVVRALAKAASDATTALALIAQSRFPNMEPTVLHLVMTRFVTPEIQNSATMLGRLMDENTAATPE